MTRKTQNLNSVETRIRKICDQLSQMLIEKNRGYGNSVLEPVRIFSRATTVEQIYVRLDDKLSRICHGKGIQEDTFWDMAGYLIMLLIALERRESAGTKRNEENKGE